MELLQRITADALNPALAGLPPRFDTPEARVELLAICLQESRGIHRFQVVDGNPNAKGPARGLLQFERMGGVNGVLTHRATKQLAQQVCAEHHTAADPRSVWLRLEFDDVLAFKFGRLLLLCDPAPLPELGDKNGAWDCYIRNWRPGKPHWGTWNGFYAKAIGAVA